MSITHVMLECEKTTANTDGNSAGLVEGKWLQIIHSLYVLKNALLFSFFSFFVLTVRTA